MEVKEYSQYTQEEKEEILMHWFHYYGKECYLVEELEQFQMLVKEHNNEVFILAVLSYIHGDATHSILEALRQNKLDQLFQMISDHTGSMNSNKGYAAMFHHAMHQFIEEVVESYNHPKADVPFREEELKKQVQKIQTLQEENKKLNSERVVDTFRACLFTEEEIQDNKPTEEYTSVTGVQATVTFNTERLNQHKKDINEMVDLIANIEQGSHFFDLCVTKSGRIWTGEHGIVDQLMILGLATEVLEVPFHVPRELWGSVFPEGLPYVIKNPTMVDKKVVGNLPEYFPAKRK